MLLSVFVLVASFPFLAQSPQVQTNPQTGETTVVVSTSNGGTSTNVSYNTSTGQQSIYTQVTAGGTYIAGPAYESPISKRIRELEASDPKSPELPDLYYQIGQIADKIEQYQQAVDYYKKAIAKSEELIKAGVKVDKKRVAEYCLLSARGWPIMTEEEAIEVLIKGIKWDPSNAKLHNVLSCRYFDAKKFDKAIEEQQLAVSLDPINETYKRTLDYIIDFKNK